MTLASERQAAVAATVAKIRDIETARGVTRESLEDVKQALIELAGHKTLFPPESFPSPEPDSLQPARLYRLSEDDDHRFALYINSAHGKVDSPPHDHTTWAVVVGIQGTELNRVYECDDKSVDVVAETPVQPGSVVAFLPDDVHSIHIDGTEPVLNFHMYGYALTELHERKYFNKKEGGWSTFPALREYHEPVDEGA